MVKAVLFDMDGVLVDSYNAWLLMFNKVLKHYEDKEITEKEFKKKVWARSIDQVAKEYFSVDKHAIEGFFSENINTIIKHMELFSDALSTVTALKERGIKVAVVTNTKQAIARSILTHLKIYPLLDYLIGGDNVKVGKPSPEIILKTLNDMKLKKQDACFVGDAEFDQLAAKSAGIRFIGVRMVYPEKISALSELLAVI